jgi:hypothetical protein
MEIGGLSQYEMIGGDTIKGDKLKDFPPKEGKIPWALVKSKKDADTSFYRIIWIDQMNKKRRGIIRVRPKEAQ